jgi:ABC-type branched-subunit amino acid transport system ATPase component
MTLQESEHLTKRFGGVVAVYDVWFAVDQREAVRIM